jgi:hypothetical protein
VLRIADTAEYTTYMNATDACSEWLHVFVTLRDEIRDHVASIDS